MAAATSDWRQHWRKHRLTYLSRACVFAAWSVFIAVVTGWATAEYLLSSRAIIGIGAQQSLYSHLHSGAIITAFWLGMAGILWAVDRSEGVKHG